VGGPFIPLAGASRSFSFAPTIASILRLGLVGDDSTDVGGIASAFWAFGESSGWYLHPAGWRFALVFVCPHPRFHPSVGLGGGKRKPAPTGPASVMWSWGELNPRPEMRKLALSTCLDAVCLSG